MEPIILVATDFSDLADLALTHGLRLARRMNAKLVIAHVAAPPLIPLPGFAGRNESELKEDALRLELDRLCDEAIANGIATRGELMHGAVVPALLDLIAREQPEVVVVGCHGRRGVAKWVLGSVSDALCRRSPSPVMVVTDPARRETIREDNVL